VIDDDADFEDEQDTGPIRLWPALAALGVMAVIAVVVAFAALRSNEEDEPGSGPERTMRLVLAAPGDGGSVRLVTAAACLSAVRASADLRADAVAFTVYGQEPGGVCTADIEVRCNEVVLPQAVGPRRVVPEPVAEYRDRAEALVASGPCPPIAVEA
jgi:hypothetical protein